MQDRLASNFQDDGSIDFEIVRLGPETDPRGRSSGLLCRPSWLQYHSSLVAFDPAKGPLARSSLLYRAASLVADDMGGRDSANESELNSQVSEID